MTNHEALRHAQALAREFAECHPDPAKRAAAAQAASTLFRMIQAPRRLVFAPHPLVWPAYLWAGFEDCAVCVPVPGHLVEALHNVSEILAAHAAGGAGAVGALSARGILGQPYKRPANELRKRIGAVRDFLHYEVRAEGSSALVKLLSAPELSVRDDGSIALNLQAAVRTRIESGRPE